jgi:hypothetical protein
VTRPVRSGDSGQYEWSPSVVFNPLELSEFLEASHIGLKYLHVANIQVQFGTRASMYRQWQFRTRAALSVCIVLHGSRTEPASRTVQHRA